MGTRNYILEEMIKTLKMLKSGSSSEIDAKNDKKTLKTADEKLTDEIAKLVKLIPTVEELSIEPIVPAPIVPAPLLPVALGMPLSAFDRLRMAAAMESDDDDLAAIDEMIAMHNETTEPLEVSETREILVAQPPGQFNCRMLACTERLPICRMWNHLRTFHSTHMVEHSVVDNDFATHFTFPYESYRRAVHIPRFGLFFFIVNVKKESKHNNVITAWLQMVGRRDQCRRFSYELRLRVGNRVATYKDVVRTICNHFPIEFR